jgi:hypothetical protein
MSRRHYEQILSVVGVLAFIAAQQMLGGVAAVRVAGLICLVCAAFWLVPRSLAAGSKGQGTGHFLGVTPALLAGMAMLAAGIALLAFPARAACLLGWAACV